VLSAIDQRLGTKFAPASAVEDFADADAVPAEIASPENAARQALRVGLEAETQGYDRFCEAEAKCARVQEMWRWSVAICRDDIVDRYLRSRGIALDRHPPVLRFHCSMWHPDTGSPWPVMLARVDSADGTFCAVHRTFLDPADAGKAKDANGIALPRMMLGTCGGSAVHLFDPGGDALLVGEGIETTLSALVLARWKFTGWATLGTSGMARLAVPARFRRVLIAADRDLGGQGVHAAKALARRLQRAGVRVIIRTPTLGKDFNDELVARLKKRGDEL
jgi:hypothetical protein